MKRICRKKMEAERRSENEGGQIMTEREKKNNFVVCNDRVIFFSCLANVYAILTTNVITTKTSLQRQFLDVPLASKTLKIAFSFRTQSKIPNIGVCSKLSDHDNLSDKRVSGFTPFHSGWTSK
jgi:hypothetical protein